MPRYRHDGARAVFHQHKVSNPDGYLYIRERVPRGQARGHPALFHFGHVRLSHLDLAHLGDEGRKLRIVLRRLSRQRMLGCYRYVGHAHQRVRPGGIDRQALVAGTRERQFHAVRPANPVALHDLDLFWPAGHVIQRF